MFKEIISVYCENDSKHVNTKNSELLYVMAGGTYKYQYTFKVYPRIKMEVSGL
jgi:hypothetical protein